MFKKEEKKKERKLRLSRETLRNLTASELTQVNGGMPRRTTGPGYSGSCISTPETEKTVVC